MNLKSARNDIVAARDHALEGLAYYQKRVESLNRLLEQLDSVGDLTELESPAKVQPAANMSDNAPSVRRQKKGKEAAPLPRTGSDFFQKLLSSEKRTMGQLLDAAFTQLGIKPSREQTGLLRGRLTTWLYTALKDSSTGVNDEGSGRQRVFFKQ